MRSDGSEGIGRDLRVLVIDDDATCCEILRAALSEWGFAVETLYTLQAAIRRSERENYDLVLVDRRLPDGSGLTLCKLLRHRAVSCKAMLMTASPDAESAISAIRDGAVDYFEKPLDMKVLQGRLAVAIDTLRAERERTRKLADLEGHNALLEGMAVRYPLTHLYNHAYLQDALSRELSRSERHHRTFSFALLDIDRFNEVNDRFGHSTGDQILREVAHMLAGPSRAADMQFHLAEQDLAARFGGDVFALILPETPRAGASIRLERLRGMLRKIDLGVPGLPHQTLSAGLVSYPDDARDREGLVKAAQTALAAAKHAGGDLMVSYSKGMEASRPRAAAEQSRKAQALGRSLVEGSFRFVYQPIVRSRDHGIFAYEALCRPTDADFTHVGELFETAVSLGRIRDLGRVLRPLSVIPMEQLPEGQQLFINLHPQDLDDPILLRPEPELGRWSDRIVFEVTETEAIVDYKRARQRIETLRSHGFRVALDDLGSGYSTLGCLAQFEPDFVKLDMELIRGIQHESRAARLIRYLLDFCEGEGALAIAEGIETVEELRVVQDLGVPLVQGFLFARPADAFCNVEEIALAS